jgi:hypothetical protein
MPNYTIDFAWVLILLTLMTILLSDIVIPTTLAAFAISERIETVKFKDQLIPFSSFDIEIPYNTLLNFSAGGEVCPKSSNCFGELRGWVTPLDAEDGILSDLYIDGIVEFNETHSTKVNGLTINWTELPVHGGLGVLDIWNDVSQNKTVYHLMGRINMEESPIGPYFYYDTVNGTLELPLGNLTIAGQRIIRAE